MAKSFLHDNSGVSVIIGAMLLILITVVAAAGLALIVSQTEKQAADRQAQIDAVNSEQLKVASISITNGSPPYDKKIDNLAIDILNMNTAGSKIMALIVNGKYVSNYTVVSNSPGFTADVTSGNNPLTVHFNDASQNSPITWEWDFGDGTAPQILQNPVHTYNYSGNYSVTLKATSGSGSDQITKINYIVVKDPSLNYAVDFSSDVQTGHDPLTVHFHDQSTNSPTSWDWDFGDGTAHGNTSNPTHVYASAGSFDVNLTVNNGSGHMIKSKYIITDTTPNADFNYYFEPNYGMVPVKVDFIDSSYGYPTQWDWDFGDGSAHDTSQNPTHVYTNPGAYIVTLNVKNIIGWSSSAKTRQIVIDAPVQKVMPMIIDGGAHSYININKIIGNSQDLGITTDHPITIEIVTSYVNYFKTTYNPPNAIIKANIETQNLGNSQSRDYIVLDGSDSSSANSTIVSWKWDISNYANTAHYVMGGRITQFYPPTNEGYKVSLTVIDNNGMTDTSDTISIPSDMSFNPIFTPAPTPTPTATPTAIPTQKPVADFTADITNGSPPVYVQFTDTSSNNPTTWDWDFGDGGKSTDKNPIHKYSNIGTYTVSLNATNAGGSSIKTRSGYITIN
jgi:PKD repeat protein